MKYAYGIIVVGALAAMAIPTLIQVNVRLTYRRTARAVRRANQRRE